MHITSHFEFSFIIICLLPIILFLLLYLPFPFQSLFQRLFLILVGRLEEEMLALKHNDTWDLFSLTPGKSAVGCRWVYTVKVNPDGSVERLKARLVAKGYTQIYGLD